MIPLFFSDFKRFVVNGKFRLEENIHPVTYYEREEFITFYKPIGNFIYSTTIDKLNLPEGMNIKQEKIDLSAITELPAPLNTGSRIIMEGTLT